MRSTRWPPIAALPPLPRHGGIRILTRQAIARHGIAQKRDTARHGGTTRHEMTRHGGAIRHGIAQIGDTARHGGATGHGTTRHAMARHVLQTRQGPASIRRWTARYSRGRRPNMARRHGWARKHCLTHHGTYRKDAMAGPIVRHACTRPRETS